MLRKIEEAMQEIRSRSDLAPRIGLILGSGLGSVVEGLEVETIIPYEELPHAPRSSVIGHSGRMILGHAGELPVIVLQGRVHFYEGLAMEEVIFLARVIGRLGIRQAIVTNAAGGVNTSFAPGDLMLIADHINLLGLNPLRGANADELGVRFPDLTKAYPVELRALAREAAAEIDLEPREGVYLAVSGPSYETPAEIRAFRTLGADAVGMSTVPEVIALAHMGIPVLGISCITNMAAGILPQPLTHDEVLETTARVQKEFTALVLGAMRRMAFVL